MNTMDQIKVRYGEDNKLVSLQEFFEVKDLSGITKKIQDSLKMLYQLNGKGAPLFHFPDFPESSPLIVDCTTATVDNCGAHYMVRFHVIEFVKSLHDNPYLSESYFAEILAHELTHAEVDDGKTEPSEMMGLQYQQYMLFNEANAFTKEKMIRAMLKGKERYSDSERIEAIEKEMQRLLTDSFYRSGWEDHRPLKEGDQPLASIPAVFHLPDRLLSSAAHFPEIMLRPEVEKMSKMRKHEDDVRSYFWNSDEASRIKSAKRLLLRLLFKEKTSEETFQQDAEMVHFLLRLLKKDGTPIFQGNLSDVIFELELDGQIYLTKDNRTNGSFGRVAEGIVDSEGKKIFPENFAKKISAMSMEEFSECIDRYVDFVTPVLLIDDMVETEDKSKKKKSKKTKETKRGKSKKTPIKKVLRKLEKPVASSEKLANAKAVANQVDSRK